MSKQQSQSTIYVGGLDSEVNSETLHAAFLPFGEIIHISIPTDQNSLVIDYPCTVYYVYRLIMNEINR